MTRFTNSPLERLMQQVPRVQPVEPAAPIVLPHGHPCRGCKRYAEKCEFPCYRGITHKAKPEQ